MTDYVASLIRTFAPGVVSVALVWISQTLEVTSIATDENKAKVMAAVFVVYYAVVRLLEKKFPKAGWLLFLAKEPSYPATP